MKTSGVRRNIKALALNMKILHMTDYPYRYDPYAPVESGFFIESAFFDTGLENEKDHKAASAKLYKLVAERINYIEVKGDFYEMEKEAAKFLENIK